MGASILRRLTHANSNCGAPILTELSRRYPLAPRYEQWKSDVAAAQKYTQRTGRSGIRFLIVDAAAQYLGLTAPTLGVEASLPRSGSRFGGDSPLAHDGDAAD